MWVMELVLPELSLAALGTATAPRRDARVYQTHRCGLVLHIIKKEWEFA